MPVVVRANGTFLLDRRPEREDYRFQYWSAKKFRMLPF
jgi:hypothetical protein